MIYIKKVSLLWSYQTTFNIFATQILLRRSKASVKITATKNLKLTGKKHKEGTLVSCFYAIAIHKGYVLQVEKTCGRFISKAKVAISILQLIIYQRHSIQKVSLRARPFVDRCR